MVSAAIDLGKSRCRLLVRDGEEPKRVSGAGAPGLAARGGVESALEAVLPLLDEVGAAVDVLGVGAAGAWGAPDAAQRLAEELSARTGARVAVASDVVTAHAGAFAGLPGVLLIAGTGAAALGVSRSGVRLVDGWGPELGDLGGGSWLGREGMRAVLRYRDGLGAATALTEAAHRRTAPVDVLAWLHGPEPVARRLASFAPDVLDAASSGDEVAAAIAAEAVELLTATATAAVDDQDDIVLHGGLTEHRWLRSRLESAIGAVGRGTRRPAGDALDGALLLTERTDLPHERYVHRAG
ncbi:N-acetylglucosamine kinase [Microbacterium sp. NPDC055903]